MTAECQNLQNLFLNSSSHRVCTLTRLTIDKYDYRRVPQVRPAGLSVARAHFGELKGEVKAKIKISPVVVFGVLSRMVLVRES